MFDSVKSQITGCIVGIRMAARAQVVASLPSPLGLAGVQPATTGPLTSQLQTYLRAYFTNCPSIFMRHKNNKSAQYIEQSSKVQDCRGKSTYSRVSDVVRLLRTTFHSTARYYLHLKLSLLVVELISREGSSDLMPGFNGSMCTSVQTLYVTL